jgi:hypothetical protein
MYCGPRHGIRPIDHHTKSISSNKHSRRTKTKKHKKKQNKKQNKNKKQNSNQRRREGRASARRRGRRARSTATRPAAPARRHRGRLRSSICPVHIKFDCLTHNLFRNRSYFWTTIESSNGMNKWLIQVTSPQLRSKTTFKIHWLTFGA